MTYGVKHRFVEVALKGVGAQKLHRQSGRANERTQNPAELTAEEQVSSEPGEKDFVRDAFAAAQRLQQTKQPEVGRRSSEGDDNDLCELDKIVGRPRDLRLAGERRRVPDDEEHDGRKRTEDHRRNREAHQHEHERLAKAEVQPKQRREHAVEQRIAESGRQNDEREFQEVVAGLKRRAPVAHRRAIQTRAGENNSGIPEHTARFPARRPLLERLRVAAEQHGDLPNLEVGRRSAHRICSSRDSSSRRAQSACRATSTTGYAINASATLNSGQLKPTGNMVRSASVPWFAARRASLMKTNNASVAPAPPSARDFQLEPKAEECSNCVTKVPHKIIRKAMLIGAQTGPHQGSGMRNRMSQFDSDRGHQPVMTRRKT